MNTKVTLKLGGQATATVQLHDPNLNRGQRWTNTKALELALQALRVAVDANVMGATVERQLSPTTTETQGVTSVYENLLKVPGYFASRPTRGDATTKHSN